MISPSLIKLVGKNKDRSALCVGGRGGGEGGGANECKESCKAENFKKSTLTKARHMIDVFISHDGVLISWSCG